MRALDVLGRVEADDAHHVAEAGGLAREREAGAQLGALLVVGVHEQLGGVVARLAVDLDLAAEVRRVLVVEPVVVGEPGVALGQHDELAGALVRQPGRGQRLALEHLAHAVERGDRLARGRDVGRVLYIHVRDLVVGDREGARGPRVQVLHARLRVDVQQAGAAQGAVDLDRALGGRDAVLAQDDDLVAAVAGVVDEVAEHVVELTRGVQRLRALGAEALVVVVEVRQVDQQQVELLVVEHDLGRVGDPLRAT